MVKCIPSIYEVLDLTPSTRKSYDYVNLNKLKHLYLELCKVQYFPGSLRVYFKSFLADIKCEFSYVNINPLSHPWRRGREIIALCGLTCNTYSSVPDTALVVI